ncbi:MAG TPA: Dyp-type peroxidase [Thermoanaerobaculia bacterium]|nr:Dyp-type peroxidase [Thermoanaerobaculia bacterium]
MLTTPTDLLRQLPKFNAMPRHTGPDVPEAPAEPRLAINDIQGNIFPGFNKPTTYFTAFRIDDVAGAKAWLAEIVGFISTAEEVLAFRRLFSARRKRLRGAKPPDLVDTNTNIAFSYDALRKLAGADADAFEDAAFRIGLPDRAESLGDSTDPTQWVIGGPGNIPDVLMITGGDDEDVLRARVQALTEEAEKRGVVKIWEDVGLVRRDLPGHEHFGFDDGISQPGPRGTLSDIPNDYLTPRYIDVSAGVEALLFGLPGQDLVWPGEFVFGYPAQGPDPLVAGPVKSGGAPAWAANGSFLAFNRLEQNVKKFWTFMTETAEELAKQPGFAGMTPDKLAAHLVGRWQSGAPVSRTPNADDPTLGQDQYANNHFFYGSDTKEAPLHGMKNYSGGPYPGAKADPLGLTCPLAAHIRKVNTRDVSNDQGGTHTTTQRRVLRRGMPYGLPLENPFGPDPEHGNRGLMFVSYQTSIVEQFEFLRANWMGDAKPPRMPGGDDMIVGMNGQPGEQRERKCVLFGSELQTAEPKTREEWILQTGGGYFFSPAISAIKDVLAAHTT